MERVRGMEVLRQDDLERARRTRPEEKAQRAFALMGFGLSAPAHDQPNGRLRSMLAVR